MKHLNEIRLRVLEISIDLEEKLRILGGYGNGLIEKARSIKGYLNRHTFKNIKFIGRIRNKLVHKANPDLNIKIGVLEKVYSEVLNELPI